MTQVTTYRPLLTLDILSAFRTRWTWPDALGQELRLKEPAHLLAVIPAGTGPESKIRVELMLGDSADPENLNRALVKVAGAEIAMADLLSGKAGEGTIDEPFLRARWRMTSAPGNRLFDLQLDDLWLGAANNRFLAGMRVAIDSPNGVKAVSPFTLVDSTAPGRHLALETDHAGNVFTGGETPILRIRAFNIGPEAGMAPCKISLTDHLTSQSLSVAVSLNFAGGAAVKEAPLVLPGYGVWDVKVSADGATSTSAATRICYIPTPVKDRPDASPFGVNLFQQQLWSYAFDLPLLAKAGVKWVRPWLAWENTWAMQERTKGTPDWTPTDTMLNRCEEYGLRYLYMLYGAPQWLHPGAAQPWASTAEENQEWVDYARRVAARYGSRIPVMEHWNEPWGLPFNATGAQFASLARALSAGMRAAAPEAVRLGTGGVYKVGFLQEYADAGGLNECDAIASHCYFGQQAPENGNGDLVNELATHRDVLLRAGRPDLPIWLDEIGYSAFDFDPQYGRSVGVTEIAQAQYLTREYLLALSTGYVRKVFWFCSLDPRDSTTKSGPPSGDSGIGMMYMGYAPKLAYNALAAMCREMGSPKILGRITAPAPIQAYAWEAGDETVITAWSATGPARLTLAVSANGVRAVNMMGNPAEVGSVDGRLSMPLDGSPVYLHGVPREDIMRLLAPWRICAPRFLELQAGTTKTLAVALSQAPRATQYAVKCSAPERVTITGAPATVSLEPGVERLLTMQVHGANDTLLAVGCNAPQEGALALRLMDISATPVYTEDFKDNPLPGRWSSTSGNAAGRVWEAAAGRSGTAGLHLERAIGAWQGLVTPAIGVKPNTRYVYSAWGKYRGVNGIGARALVRDLVNNRFFDCSVLQFNSPEWTHAYGVFTTPGNTDKVGLRLELPGEDPGGDGWFDDLVLTEAPE